MSLWSILNKAKFKSKGSLMHSVWSKGAWMDVFNLSSQLSVDNFETWTLSQATTKNQKSNPHHLNVLFCLGIWDLKVGVKLTKKVLLLIHSTNIYEIQERFQEKASAKAILVGKKSP